MQAECFEGIVDTLENRLILSCHNVKLFLKKGLCIYPSELIFVAPQSQHIFGLVFQECTRAAVE